MRLILILIILAWSPTNYIHQQLNDHIAAPWLSDDPLSDLNDDGIVNFKDYAMFAERAERY